MTMGKDPHPFYVPPGRFAGDRVLFDAEEAHHILAVVRLQEGAICRVTDGCGGRYVVRLAGGRVGLEGIVLESETPEDRPVTIELGFPLLRVRSRTDWLLEKGVEVGVDRFVPIRWARTVREEHAARSADRWRRILREAMKQSERAWLPELAEAQPPEGDGAAPRIVLADPEGPEEAPIDAGSRAIRLLVGPEGGATDEERRRLLDAGARLWSLGPRRLRAETAAIVGAFSLARALRSGAGSN